MNEVKRVRNDADPGKPVVGSSAPGVVALGANDAVKHDEEGKREGEAAEIAQHPVVLQQPAAGVVFAKQ